MTIAALGAGKFAWWWLSGIVLAAAFVPVALFGPRGVLGQIGVIAPVLAIVTVLCTWSEVVIFFPALREQATNDMRGGLLMYFIITVVLAVLGWGLRLPKPLSDNTVPWRSPSGTLAMIVICGIAYAIFYLVFGAITYQFFTKAYYPEGAQIARSFGLWFWLIQIGRGALMTAAVVPAIYTLRMNRWQTAISIGVLVWVAGGLAPLLVPNALMGPTQRMIHIVEILTQNVPLGIFAGLLLRPKPGVRSASSPRVAAASF
jgi:hypothetical protein